MSAAGTSSSGARRITFIGRPSADERGEASRRSYAVHRATAAREEPIRPDEQDDDHRREEKARQVLALVRGEHAAKNPVREADREAPERGWNRPIEAAADDSGEHEDRVVGAER